ncbi:MAG: element excision factor XisH family protein [Saprospiraceae bacterium]
MARDKFHHEFREALENDGWTVTHDPLTFKIGKIQVQIDLGAERLIAAERGEEKIAVEIKTFVNASFITALYEAVGKYIIYRNIVEMKEPDRILYMATPEPIYDEFFKEEVLQETLRKEKFKLIVYNPDIQTITQWIK